MYRPTYELGSFLPVSAEDRIRILRALLEALASTNAVYLGPRG
jgi:hypothetical protein